MRLCPAREWPWFRETRDSGGLRDRRADRTPGRCAALFSWPYASAGGRFARSSRLKPTPRYGGNTMAEIKITAEPRANFGKGAARQLRREGKIPAVLYGHKQEPVHLSLPEHDLFLALKNSNVLLSLDIVGGTSELAIPKAVSKDPVKRTLEHIDLLLVRRGEKVTVDIPVVATGEIAPGGLLELVLTSLSVETEATH